jgi:hypothetical protein
LLVQAVDLEEKSANGRRAQKLRWSMCRGVELRQARRAVAPSRAVTVFPCPLERELSEREIGMEGRRRGIEEERG